MESSIETKRLDHLGLVAGMFDELGLGEGIDTHIHQNMECRHLSVGQCVKALVINGMGFAQRSLYMVGDFFKGKPLDLLIGPGVESGHLNDCTLGRALDAIHAYGTTELFWQLSPLVCKQLGLAPDAFHLDATSFHLDGAYNSEGAPPESTIHLTRGYSRDHRPDLNQAVLNMVVDNIAGIPLHIEALSGNSSDRATFRQTVESYSSRLQSVSDLGYLVMDSAGYSIPTIEAHAPGVKWISRVPEMLGECQEAIERGRQGMEPLCKGYSSRRHTSKYGGVEQRWLVVWSEAAYEREVKSARRKWLDSSQKELSAMERLMKEKFGCEQDALKAAEQLQGKSRHLHLEDIRAVPVKRYKGRGRPKKGQQPETVAYQIEARACCRVEAFRAAERRKGVFVIATNETDRACLTDLQLLQHYKGQAKVERGFRFLKDPLFIASAFFVEKPERVEALLLIMALCLTVYAALEYRIRQRLAEEGLSVPDQKGKPTSKPTARWVFIFFTGIDRLYGFQDKPLTINIEDRHKTIIRVLGKVYEEYYQIE